MDYVVGLLRLNDALHSAGVHDVLIGGAVMNVLGASSFATLLLPKRREKLEWQNASGRCGLAASASAARRREAAPACRSAPGSGGALRAALDDG